MDRGLLVHSPDGHTRLFRNVPDHVTKVTEHGGCTCEVLHGGEGVFKLNLKHASQQMPELPSLLLLRVCYQA